MPDPDHVRVSIALATCNGERYLREQLDSIARQSRLPDELIVSDDASDDATPAIIEEFRSRATFPVVMYRQETNVGTSKNFDLAIAKCSGDWIFLCDQDDVWRPTKIATFLNAIRETPEARLLAGDAIVVDEAGSPLGVRLWQRLPFTDAMRHTFESDRGARFLARKNRITGATCAVHASLRSLILPIPEVGFHDAWIALLAAATSSCATIAEPLMHYRRHSRQQVGDGPTSIWRRIANATRRDAIFFERESRFFAAASARLAASNCPLRDPGLPDDLSNLATFCQSRADLRRCHRLTRLAMVCREAVRGRYHRFARGLPTILADAFL